MDQALFDYSPIIAREPIVPGMLSVPYSVELNDLNVFLSKGLTGPDFVQLVKDQLDQLYSDAAGSGRVMALPLHPFVISQPFGTGTWTRRSSTSRTTPGSG